MPSPFPGVDPYLEAQGLWADFHSKFINVWQEALLEKLPPGYDARLNEHVYLVHDHEEPGKLIIPDVAIEQLPDTGGGTAVAVGTRVETEIVTLPVPYEVRESYIEIRKHPERTLVAVLELLSPTNKGSERAAYLEKRDEILVSTVHLVEVDLLIRGRRLPMSRRRRPAHYHALTGRGDERPRCRLHSWSIRDPLPTVGIPLAEPGLEVPSDLGEVFRTAWQRGRYERAIDYARPLDLRFQEQDLKWIRDQLSHTAETAPRRAAPANDSNQSGKK